MSGERMSGERGAIFLKVFKVLKVLRVLRVAHPLIRSPPLVPCIIISMAPVVITAKFFFAFSYHRSFPMKI